MKGNLGQERGGEGNHLSLLPRTIYVQNRPKTVMAKAQKNKLRFGSPLKMIKESYHLNQTKLIDCEGKTINIL